MTSRIRQMMLFGVLAIAGLPSVQAADTEVFGGYSVTRMRPENGSNSAKMSGWNTSITSYPWKRFGLAADFAGYYGSANNTAAGDVNLRQYSFMGGPQLRVLQFGRMETSVRALFGGAYGYVPGAAGNLADQTTFAALFGSNIDVKVSRRISMRFSPGLYVTQYGTNQTQKNLRFSFGPVFKFGGES